MSERFLAVPVHGPSSPRWVLARILRVTVGPLVRVLWRVRVLGTENLPPSGGYILAGNHVSYLDPVILWCIAPRPTHFIARQDLFGNAFLGWLLPRVWVFPITRASADRTAITRATTLLQLGELVGMFPEGTRRLPGELEREEGAEAHSGVSFIALRAGAPVVPVGISGMDEAMPRGARFPRFPRVTVRFGEPVDPASFEETDRKERLAAMTAEIMRRIRTERRLAGGE